MWYMHLLTVRVEQLNIDILLQVFGVGSLIHMNILKFYQVRIDI